MNTLENKYYVDLDDIPLRNFKKALEESKVAYVRRDWNKGTDQDDVKAWEGIYDQYLLSFGLGDKREEFLDLQMQCIDVCLEYAETGDRFLLNEYNRLVAEINSIMAGSEGGGGIDDAVVYVIHATKVPIDEKSMSAKTFFKLFHRVVEEHKRQSNGKGHTQED